MNSGPSSAFTIIARWAKLGLAVVLGCLLAVGVAREQLSVHWEHTDPKLALRINPNNPEALTTQAKALYDAGHITVPSALSRRIVVLDPLSDSAPRILAEDAHEKNRPALQRAMLDFAKRAGWRDFETQYMIVDRAVPLQDWSEAAPHTDAMLRMHPSYGATLLPWVFAHCKAQSCVTAFAKQLSRAPPWRAEAIETAAKKLDPPQLFALLDSLRAANAPVKQDELASAVNALVGRKQYAEAYQLWRSWGPSSLLRLDFRPEPLSDPDQAPSAFAWRPRSGVGYDAELDDTEAGYPGGLLKLQFDGFSSEVFAERLLALAPGAYRLDVQAAVQSGTPGELSWKIKCADGGADLASVKLNTSAPSSETGTPSAWSKTTAEFNLPPTGCPAQWLQLVGAPGDRKIDSEVWFRDLNISPVPRRG